MGKGRTYELDIKRDAHADVDTDFVHVALGDYSGVAADTYYDLEIVYPNGHAEICGAFTELKKRSGDEGKRVTIMDGSSSGESGLDELERLIEGTPNWGDPYLVVKFDHREVIVLHAEYLHKVLTEDDVDCFDDVHPTYKGAEEGTHGARLTPSDNISMVKPELSYWPSSNAGVDDHRKILLEVGVPNHLIKSQPFEIDVDVLEDAAA